MKSSILDSIVITGGGGMLAQAFARQLKQRELSFKLARRAEYDIASPARVDALFADVKPTLLINCAAYTKVDLAETERDAALAANRDAPRSLALACKSHRIKLVHFSTDFVFNGRSKRPYVTADPTDPLSVYGASKLEGERAIQSVVDLNSVIIRTAWLYGPGGPSFPKTMLDVARAGKPLKVVNDQIGAPTFTDDLAEATLALIDRDTRGLFHVTNSGQTTWFDFARAIFEEFGLQPDLQSTTSAQWKALRPQSAIRPGYSVLDLTAAERIVGRPMPPWRDALHRFRLAVEPAKA